MVSSPSSPTTPIGVRTGLFSAFAHNHIISAPVYYHNYMMGELFASQLHHAIARDVYKNANPDTVVYVGNKDVGVVGTDVYTASTAFILLESIRLDLGVGSQIHP